VPLDDLSFELPPDAPKMPSRPVAETRQAAAEPYLDRARPRPQAAEPVDFSHRADEGLDDAMAVLRAAEARGKVANERTARAIPRSDEQPGMDRQRTGAGSKPLPIRTEAPAAPEPVAANESWSTRSRDGWPKVLAAAAVALIVGGGLGYIYGTAPESGASKAKIQVTPDGGTRLKAAQELSVR
jgi:hypothetical protein